MRIRIINEQEKGSADLLAFEGFNIGIKLFQPILNIQSQQKEVEIPFQSVASQRDIIKFLNPVIRNPLS